MPAATPAAENVVAAVPVLKETRLLSPLADPASSTYAVGAQPLAQLGMGFEERRTSLRTTLTSLERISKVSNEALVLIPTAWYGRACPDH